MIQSSSDDFVPSDLIQDRAISAADADLLKTHSPIASELAHLAATERPPLTIGVFGPWGSGKSSVLKIAASKLRSRGEAVVELDAWKHAELPLARQFVSATAEQLVEAKNLVMPFLLGGWRRRRLLRRANREVWSQLYESRRRRSIRPWEPGALREVLVASLVLLAFISLVVVLGGGAWAALANLSLKQGIRAIAPELLGASAVAALLTLLATTMSIDSEEVRPGSEEELENALRHAIDRFAGERNRVIFLVDELDRCPPREVLSTLRTIRTFLGVDKTVFIVAADREVVDEALIGLHGSPADPVATYYGSVGSILDKLFQIQLDIPPVRQRRLTYLAQELVEGQPGIWSNLADDDLEEILPVLIPTHVRSPRRVKVLLNAFVTAMHIAQIRREEYPNEVADPSDDTSRLPSSCVSRRSSRGSHEISWRSQQSYPPSPTFWSE